MIASHYWYAFMDYHVTNLAGPVSIITIIVIIMYNYILDHLRGFRDPPLGANYVVAFTVLEEVESNVKLLLFSPKKNIA